MVADILWEFISSGIGGCFHLLIRLHDMNISTFSNFSWTGIYVDHLHSLEEFSSYHYCVDSCEVTRERKQRAGSLLINSFLGRLNANLLEVRGYNHLIQAMPI